MRKNIFSVFMVIVMIAALMLSVTGCSEKDDASAERIAQLEQENAALKAQVDALTVELGNMKQRAALQTWSLTPTAWNDGNGATVTFSATPVNYVDGQRAALSVRMGDLEAEGTNCVWDGNAFVGSVELSAADGYGYYCILTSPDGAQEEIALNTPDSVTNETLVYLGTNLTTYANLILEDWVVADNILTIQSGYAQVQMPRLTTDGSLTVNKAELVLKLNGEENTRQTLNLSAGEGDGSYEMAFSGNSFAMPAAGDDFQLDLLLEITLSNGTTVTAEGGSWYSNNGELDLVVG